MYYDDYDDDDTARRWKLIAAAAVVVLLAALAFWQLRRDSGPNEAAPATSQQDDALVSGTTTDAPSATSTDPTDRQGTEPSASTGDADDDAPSSTTSRATVPTTTDADGADADGTDAGGSAPATSGAPGSESPPPTVTVGNELPVPSDPDLGYPTSPDGTPLPVLVIFDTETITVSGQVPTQAAKERLGALAIANSQFPDAELIDNMVINPAVPISVGVRVIELNSARFPEASAQILPDHARELDRVVTIMQALPNISVLVVGHADQRGDDLRNFAISDERARAVVNYLLYLGISPTRLASRAAGETDLLTLGDDESALTLNRRTEFIFYGLLVE